MRVQITLLLISCIGGLGVLKRFDHIMVVSIDLGPNMRLNVSCNIQIAGLKKFQLRLFSISTTFHQFWLKSIVWEFAHHVCTLCMYSLTQEQSISPPRGKSQHLPALLTKDWCVTLTALKIFSCT